MFLKEPNYKSTYSPNQIQFDVPEFIKNPDFTLSPKTSTGVYSGPFFISQYYDSIRLMSKNSLPELNETQIIDYFYTTILRSGNSYITLSDGLSKLCQTLNLLGGSSNTLITYGLKTSTLDPTTYYYNIVKHMIHKHSIIVAELLTDSSYCSTSSTEMIGKFTITTSTGIECDNKLTKAFLACGYDSDGILLFNTLGKGYGSNGFIKMKWDVFYQNRVKVAAITNLYY